MGAQIRAVPWVRQLVIDTGRAARRRHAIHGLFEVDVLRDAGRRTVGVTAVGMFGAGAGWGIGFQLHTLSVVVGGIARRPMLFQGVLVEREFLQLTVSVDHDVVDGAPAVRFVRRLRELLHTGSGLHISSTAKEPV
ncbi:2-oxo acid dehydrogenase subunit E2 [Kribbella sp. NPDC048928]|uniref:2-oxo acid dehydrogenase subunit E2 n=1 Tax=Kribbella sp. NPDC048928 TaxID=3364111 RepID=UPI00371776B2